LNAEVHARTALVIAKLTESISVKSYLYRLARILFY